MGRKTSTGKERSKIGTTTGAGTVATDTNIVCTEIATTVRQDGAAGKRPVGAIADYRRAKPKKMDAGLTFTRAVLITTTRMKVGGSSFVARSFRSPSTNLDIGWKKFAKAEIAEFYWGLWKHLSQAVVGANAGALWRGFWL
jgi:hypothetical protein